MRSTGALRWFLGAPGGQCVNGCQQGPKLGPFYHPAFRLCVVTEQWTGFIGVCGVLETCQGAVSFSFSLSVQQNACWDFPPACPSVLFRL